MEKKTPKLAVEKLMLVINSVKERRPLQVEDVIDAYEEYAELHKLQSELVGHQRSSQLVDEEEDVDGGGPNKNQYDEISKVLGMWELRLIVSNLFSIISADRERVNNKYSRSLRPRLEMAIESLQ